MLIIANLKVSLIIFKNTLSIMQNSIVFCDIYSTIVFCDKFGIKKTCIPHCLLSVIS